MTACQYACIERTAAAAAFFLEYFVNALQVSNGLDKWTYYRSMDMSAATNAYGSNGRFAT